MPASSLDGEPDGAGRDATTCKPDLAAVRGGLEAGGWGWGHSPGGW